MDGQKVVNIRLSKGFETELGKGYKSPETPRCALLITRGAVRGEYQWLHTGDDWVTVVRVMASCWLQNLLH